MVIDGAMNGDVFVAYAEQVVEDDPVLSRHPDLLRAVDRLRESEQADYLEKA